MTYQLEVLEKWIRTNIHPETLLKAIPENYLKECLDFVTSDKDRICNYFRDQAIKGEPPVPTAKFIEAHQVGIATITEVIIEFTRSKEFELPPELRVFYFKVCQIIEEIIKFLIQHLPDLFNEDIPITYSNAEQSRLDLGKQLEALQPLYQNPGMDKTLLRMISRPFREFIGEEKKISYRQLAYLKELVSGLKGLLDFDDNADITYEMHLTLFQLNFNHPRYVLHYSYWLDAKLLDIPDGAQRLDKLSWYIHAIEQVRFKSGFMFTPGVPSVTEQLLDSIKTTYRYLFAEDQGLIHSVVEQINQRAKPKNEKIRLAVSVPVLALFIKVLIKAGIIINENKAEVFRGIAENFTTLKSQSISYDSLKGKYNKTPPAAYLHLRSVLTKVIGLIREV